MQGPVLAHDLRDVEPQIQALGAVLEGVLARGGQRKRLGMQGRNQLVDESRQLVDQRGARDGLGGVLTRDGSGPALDQILPVRLEEANRAGPRKDIALRRSPVDSVRTRDGPLRADPDGWRRYDAYSCRRRRACASSPDTERTAPDAATWAALVRCMHHGDGMMRSGRRRSSRMAGSPSACLLSLAVSLGACDSNRVAAAGSATAAPSTGPTSADARARRRGRRRCAGHVDRAGLGPACEHIRGHFQALSATGRPSVMSGALWIHGCRISNTGTRVKFRLEGSGWQWIDEETKKAGGTFAVHQYVRFGVVATIAGTLDLGYDPRSHVASILFSLQGDPDVQFTPIGKLDVDAEGAWSSVLGAASSLLASSPGDSASEDVKEQGATQFRRRFAEGISVTVDLCTGMIRSGIGHTARGIDGRAGGGGDQRDHRRAAIRAA